MFKPRRQGAKAGFSSRQENPDKSQAKPLVWKTGPAKSLPREINGSKACNQSLFAKNNFKLTWSWKRV